MKKKRIICCILIIMMSCIGCASQTAKKPVIYLYPEESTKVSVELDYQGASCMI